MSTVHHSAFIHPLAVVKDSRVGAGTQVWQFASVIRGSLIGNNCCIASCAIVDGSFLGNGVRVSHGAFIDPGMSIGDDVFVGPHVSFCNDMWPRVDKCGWFDIEDLKSGKKTVTIVRRGASIGASAIIMPGVEIGLGAMISAGSVVTKNVPAGCLWRRDGTFAQVDEEKRIETRARTWSQ